MLEPKTYPRLVQVEDLETFEIHVDQVDLRIAAVRDLSGAAISAVHQVKGLLARFSETHPNFSTTLDPYPELRRDWPREPQNMIKATRLAGVGPMAAIGSCIAEYVGRALLPQSPEVIVENGGDVFLASASERTVSIYAGENSMSMHMGIKVPAEITPIGVCASSGTVGDSLSLGMADAAVAISPNVTLADAVATAMGNRVVRPRDVQSTLDWAMNIEGIIGAAIIVDNHLSIRGDAVELIEQ